MEIMPNWTVVFLQLLPFAVTAAVLYKIILMPMLDYLEERQAAIASGTTGVDAINADLEARAAEYDRQLQAARSKGSEIRNAKRVEAKAAYDEKIAAARAEAEAQISQAIEEIQLAAAEARTGLQDSSEALASQIAGQVLGRPVAQG